MINENIVVNNLFITIRVPAVLPQLNAKNAKSENSNPQRLHYKTGTGKLRENTPSFRAKSMVRPLQNHPIIMFNNVTSNTNEVKIPQIPYHIQNQIANYINIFNQLVDVLI